MGVRIKIAATAEELDQLFQVRHRVFVREKRYFAPVDDGRLLDRFDAFPSTANIVAVYEGHVVGGVRIVEPSGCGAPADEFFDFRPYLPDGAVVGSGSMLVMDEEFRRVPRVTFAMLGMMYYWALCKGLTHITGVAAPDAVKLFVGSGYRPVAKAVVHGPSGLPALPVMLNIVELNDRFTAFVDKHQFRHFLQSFERQFHQKGEYIIRRGETGTSAYVIIEGRVGVSVSGRRPSNVPPPPSRVDAGRVNVPPTPRAAPPARVVPGPTAADIEPSRAAALPPEPDQADEGPVSVRHPGRMSDRGRMVDSSSSPQTVIQNNDVPTPAPTKGRSNDVPASLLGQVPGDVPISTRDGRPISTREGRPISTREGRPIQEPLSGQTSPGSGPGSTRASGPGSTRASGPGSTRASGPGSTRASGPSSSRASGPGSSRSNGPGSSRTSAAPVSVREMGPGDVFGELALITSHPRSADVIALTDVDLMVLEREAFYRQVSQNPDVALNLLSVIGNRLMSVTDRLGEATWDEPLVDDDLAGDR